MFECTCVNKIILRVVIIMDTKPGIIYLDFTYGIDSIEI